MQSRYKKPYQSAKLYGIIYQLAVLGLSSYPSARAPIECGQQAKKSTGYNARSRAETQMGRWKAVIGPKVKARHFDNEKTEAKIGVRVLNRITELGRPKFERLA